MLHVRLPIHVRGLRQDAAIRHGFPARDTKVRQRHALRRGFPARRLRPNQEQPDSGEEGERGGQDGTAPSSASAQTLELWQQRREQQQLASEKIASAY